MDWTVFISVLAALGFVLVIALTMLNRALGFGIFEMPLRGLLAEFQDWSLQDRIYSETLEGIQTGTSEDAPKGQAQEYNDIENLRMMAELDLNRVALRLSFIAGEGRDAPIALYDRLDDLKRQLESHPYHRQAIAERKRDLLQQ